MADLRTSQESMSSLRQSSVSDGSSDEKTVYENLLEIFPLVEDFMKTQGSITRRAFSHQAPMSFTRAPSRQAPQRKKQEQKASWAQADDLPDRPESLTPMSVAPARDLQRDVDELSNRLRETQLQSSSVNKELQSSLVLKETHIIEMELMARRLQKEVQRKVEMVNCAQKELAETKNELAKMRLGLETAEINMSQTSSQAAGLKQELLDVQMELSALHSKVLFDDQALSDILRNVFHGASSDLELGPRGQMQNYQTEKHKENKEVMELARRAYLASVIVARESSEESSLYLCAMLRFQLQAFVRQNDISGDSQATGPTLSSQTRRVL